MQAAEAVKAPLQNNTTTFTVPNKQFCVVFDDMAGATDALLCTIDNPFASIKGKDGSRASPRKITHLGAKLLRLKKPKVSCAELTSVMNEGGLTRNDWLVLFPILINEAMWDMHKITEVPTSEERNKIIWFTNRLAHTNALTVCGRVVKGKSLANNMSLAWFAACAALGTVATTSMTKPRRNPNKLMSKTPSKPKQLMTKLAKSFLWTN